MKDQDVIDGKLYSIHNAERVANHNPVSDPGDFRYLNETLYLTENGEFFIAGEGGAQTTYSTRIDSTTTAGGSAIVPKTRDEARRWCEQNDISAETILEYFEDDVEVA
jgi:hypothetical protein